MKRFQLLLILCLIVPMMMGAQLPHTNSAARLCQAGDYAGALAAIDQALTDQEEKDHPYTWYVKGYIHKEIYKHREYQLRESPSRQEAVVALERSLNLDTRSEYSSMTRAALKYLASTYLNDALLRTKEITRADEGDPERLYQQFHRTMLLADPETDFSTYDKEIYRKLAQQHYALWEREVTQLYHANRAMDYYRKILAIDPTDCEANYNLCILYYNQGVYKIRRIDATTDIMQLILIQDESVQLFRQSLPFAELTFNSCPQKLDHYKAMMFINRALGNESEYERLRTESEELIRAGKLHK